MSLIGFLSLPRYCLAVMPFLRYHLFGQFQNIPLDYFLPSQPHPLCFLAILDLRSFLPTCPPSWYPPLSLINPVLPRIPSTSVDAWRRPLEGGYCQGSSLTAISVLSLFNVSLFVLCLSTWLCLCFCWPCAPLALPPGFQLPRPLV